MSECNLLAGKSVDQQALVCLACPYPDCLQGQAPAPPSQVQNVIRKTPQHRNTPRENNPIGYQASRTAVQKYANPRVSGRGIVHGADYDRLWFHSREILFWPAHCLFLIKHLDELQAGAYSPSPEGTGYTDIPASMKSRRPKSGAGFTMPADLLLNGCL